MRNPFKSGDLIETAGHTGVVESLNTRSSVLLTLDGNHVQIPNAMGYKNTIKNFSSTPHRRANFTARIRLAKNARLQNHVELPDAARESPRAFRSGLNSSQMLDLSHKHERPACNPGG